QDPFPRLDEHRERAVARAPLRFQRKPCVSRAIVEDHVPALTGEGQRARRERERAGNEECPCRVRLHPGGDTRASAEFPSLRAWLSCSWAIKALLSAAGENPGIDSTPAQT